MEIGEPGRADCSSVTSLALSYRRTFALVTVPAKDKHNLKRRLGS
jgi:hypothetical protein